MTGAIPTNPSSDAAAAPAYTEINRFVSMLSGALHALYLYRQDNKAIDEIMENLAKRFQLASANKYVIKLGITNRSILYEGNPIGSPEVTRHLSILLVEMGFKEIIFRP